VRVLLEHGIDERSSAGDTALILAVYFGKVQVVRLLLAWGADFNVRCGYPSGTPLTVSRIHRAAGPRWRCYILLQVPSPVISRAGPHVPSALRLMLCGRRCALGVGQCAKIRFLLQKLRCLVRLPQDIAPVS
jgi:hypothetical protein